MQRVASLRRGRLPSWRRFPLESASFQAASVSRIPSAYYTPATFSKYAQFQSFLLDYNSSCQRRSYTSLGSQWMLPKVQYTKYRITKPWTTDTMFDDMILSQPSRDDFARFTKETPVFMRFLKLITDVEGRQKAFIEFAKRCENGLVVEKDVYVTKKELIECLWRNGFSETEISAFEIAFPADYHFHYPELAVLFDLPEEDCYKYCIRQRAATPEELVELKYKKPTNMLSSYGLCFLGVWFGLSNTVLSNAWFYSKTFPFGAVFYMLASYFYREIREFLWKEERALAATAKESKCTGEELVYKQLKKYSSDIKCLDALKQFRQEVEQQMAAYRQALLLQMQRRMTEKVLAKLSAVEQAERQNQSSLQEVIVQEIISSAREKFLPPARNPQLQEAALRSALQAIAGENDTHLDPVAAHCKASLQQLSKTDLARITPNPEGSIAERVAAVFQKREKEFLDSFTVRQQDASEIQRLVAQCRKPDGGYDFTLLSEEDFELLEELFHAVNDRVGFDLVHEDMIKPFTGLGVTSKAFVNAVNEQLEAAKAQIRHARLVAFAQSFAA